MTKTLSLKDLAAQVGLDNFLTYRPKALEMFNIALSQLNPVKTDDIIECAFNDIAACDVSFSDQFVVNLQLHISDLKNVIVRIVQSNQEIDENIEAAINLHYKKNKEQAFVLKYDGQSYKVIGDLEKNLSDTFNLFSDKQEIMARDVAKAFNIEINSASNRLKKLYDARLLLRRELIDESGRQHIYYLP